MRKNFIFSKSVMAVSMLLVASMSFAQTSNSTYFLDGFNQRYQLNPAFAPERRVFVAIPGISNINIDAQSSVGIGNFLFESKSNPGMLTTFMSPDIDSKTFLDNLPDAASFSAGVNMDIFSLGIGAENGFTMFNVKLRNNEQVNIPKNLFAFMKAGLSPGSYLIEDMNVRSVSYIEWTLAHSHKITENLTVGMGLKFIQGLAYADVVFESIEADLSDDIWKVRTDGTLMASIPGTALKFNSEDKTIEGLEDFSFKMPHSYGFAVDLGAEYDMKDIVEGLELSASVTDLGLIGWKNLSKYSTVRNAAVDFDGFNGIDVTGDNNDVFDGVTDQFKEMIKLDETSSSASEQVMLDATFRIGAEYTTPFAKWLSFCELLTIKTGLWPYTESRTSICMKPCSWFDVVGNYAASTYGSSMGLVANLHPSGLNFFIAVDRLTAELNPQYIPINDFGLNFSVGLNLAFGEKRNK